MLITALKRSLGQGNIFTPVCHSVHGGGVRGSEGVCVVAGGCAWLRGGVHGCQGACMVAGGGGHAWLWGVCMVAGGVCIGYDKLRSMSGRYASYWNAFLFILSFTFFHFIPTVLHRGIGCKTVTVRDL